MIGMIVGVPKETFPEERRVAVVPTLAKSFEKLGVDVWVESDCGLEAGFPDPAYKEVGFSVISDRSRLLNKADVLLQVRGLGANPKMGEEDIPFFKKNQIQIGFLDPLTEKGSIDRLAGAGVIAMSMEMIPRITRAQSMDALSSMATIAGYKSVVMAANLLPRMFPMLMTAAGTVAPARVFVIGVGVAGLQAIATAKRLGAVVSAYDVRPAVKEQVQSVGAKFIEMELESDSSEDQGGYAKELGEEFYRQQRELMSEVLKDSDVVITTAAIPGKKAPTLVTREMVDVMSPGSLVIDLAAERGGNCELTRLNETVLHEGVQILGPGNLPSTVPFHASQMYSKNLVTLMNHLVKNEEIVIDRQDEITQGILITWDGDVVHPIVREKHGLPPIEKPGPTKEEVEEKADGS